MGLISFLARRNEGERHSEPAISHDGYRASIASTSLRGLSVTSNGSSQHLEAKLSQSRLASPVKPFFLGIRQDSIGNLRDSAEQAYTHPKAHGRNPRDSLRALQLRGRRLSRLDTDSMSIAPSVRSIATYSASESVTSRIGRHVDLLDAQGELRPYDFKSRIQAAGARDYGEDVAERNMGQNAVDVRSPAAQAYYASAAAAAGPRQELAGGRRANRASIMSNASSSRQSSATARRSKHAKAEAQGAKRSRRAKSTTSQASIEQAASQSEDERRGLKSTQSVSSLASASAPHVPRFRPQLVPSISPKDTSHNDSRARPKGRELHQRASRQRGATDKTRVVEAPRRQQPAAELESSDEGSVSDSAPAPSVSSYRDETARKTNRHSALPHWKSPWSHFHRDPFAAPSGGSDSRGSLAHSRDGSWRSFSSQARATAADAGRKSSLRQWSVSSVTPTTEMSDHSSNPAARPLSTHTANTSVDMSYPAAPAGDDFNMDDCDLSTDSEADSFVEKRRHAESLLFTDTVFGDLGNNLPGLFDAGPDPACFKCAAAASPAPSKGKSKSKSKGKTPTPRVRQVPTPQPENLLWRRRDRLRSLGYEYDTDESESEPHVHGRGRTPTQRPAVATMRYRTSVDSRIDEDDEEQGEVRVLSLRPLGKASSKSRLQARHGGRGIEPVLEDCEGGNAADVE
ncbi:hypothetical protein CDD81_8094 [Ophiocordyceps australis]|uniref:Uncharacterized protein n=1 Tax=Ophiocordyceps australis TaxID=1399860 RepID=A0A2C5Y2I7_9HYPO|nr:hypothetical protein CDD81_8094 [Ophiocordyceps australis]